MDIKAKAIICRRLEGYEGNINSNADYIISLIANQVTSEELVKNLRDTLRGKDPQIFITWILSFLNKLEKGDPMTVLAEEEALLSAPAAPAAAAPSSSAPSQQNFNRTRNDRFDRNDRINRGKTNRRDDRDRREITITRDTFDHNKRKNNNFSHNSKKQFFFAYKLYLHFYLIYIFYFI